MKAKEHSQEALFEHPVLERLSKTNFPLHVIWYLSTTALLVYLGFQRAHVNLSQALGLFVTGLISWSLIEYLMHRYVFHFVTENYYVQRFHHIFHGIHHAHPRDEKRTMMPPLPGALITLLYLGIFYLVLSEKAFIFVGGIILGYLIYSGLHYCIHQYKPPKHLKFLWQHHHIHHHKEPEKAFGVSSRIWDRIFGTMPDLGKSKS